jgi:GNAT superfamily N-acetyltransferase
MISAVSSPAILTATHEVDEFKSGEETLDSWLRERAMANMESAASRTYVICPAGTPQVIGYYAVCMGQVLNQEVTGAMRRNIPRQIPAVILGRLAVDHRWTGTGLGGALLRDAVERSVRASREISARLMIVHAISLEAEAFYRHHGFIHLPSIQGATYAFYLAKYGQS